MKRSEYIKLLNACQKWLQEQRPVVEAHNARYKELESEMKQRFDDEEVEVSVPDIITENIKA